MTMDAFVFDPDWKIPGSTNSALAFCENRLKVITISSQAFNNSIAPFNGYEHWEF